MSESNFGDFLWGVDTDMRITNVRLACVTAASPRKKIGVSPPIFFRGEAAVTQANVRLEGKNKRR